MSHVASSGRRRAAHLSRPPGPLPSAVLLLALMLSLPVGLRAAEGEVRLADLVDEALDATPSVRAAKRRWRARQRVRPQVTSLPDPRLELGVFLEEVETRVGPQEQALGLTQTFPLGGKLGLRGAIADKRAEASEQELELERLDVRARVAKLYYSYWFTRRSREITREVMDLIVSGERVARTRYAAGKVGQEAIVKAQVELGILENRLRTLEELAPTFVEDLNAWLDRPPGTALGKPSEADLAEREVEPTLEELYRMARELGPQIRAVRLRAESKGLERRLAGKARVPDLSVGVRWIRTGEALAPTIDSGKDPVMLTLGINLPLRRGRYRAEEEERRLERQALLESAERVANEYHSSLKRAYYEYADARRRISLYRDSLIPKGRQSMEATFTAFQAGRSSFLDLLDAERVLLDFELAAARAVAVHLEQVAEIERLVARPVSRVVRPGGGDEAERGEP